MTNLLGIITKNAVFKNIDTAQLKASLDKINVSIHKYDKNEHIVLEGDRCEFLGIVIEGALEIQNIYPSGKVTTVARMGVGQTFGEAILFSQESTYPISITAVQSCQVAFISKTDILLLMSENPTIMDNYLTLLSNRLLMLNGRIRTLSMDSLRQKICNFLLMEHKKQKSLTINVGLSRKEMAEHLAVQRPSLSRELIRMQEEGLIQFDKHTMVLLDLEAIEDEMMD